jgi:SSS family solute:Na+ symporter
MVIISLAKPEKSQKHDIIIDPSMFRVSTPFLVGSILILGILTALYTAFW